MLYNILVYIKFKNSKLITYKNISDSKIILVRTYIISITFNIGQYKQQNKAVT